MPQKVASAHTNEMAKMFFQIHTLQADFGPWKNAIEQKNALRVDVTGGAGGATLDPQGRRFTPGEGTMESGSHHEIVP